MNAPSPHRPTSPEPPAGASVHDLRKATRKMRNWYESLADYMIVHPTVSQGELAAHFGRAESTISTVVNTDSFKMYFRQRRAHHEATLDATVRDKLFKLADTSLDTMLTVLEKKKDSVPIENLQRMSEMAFKNLGYGPQPTGGVQVNVNSAPPATVNVAVSVADLERAREALRRQQSALPELEGQFTVVEGESCSRRDNSSLAPLEGGATDPSDEKPRVEDLA